MVNDERVIHDGPAATLKRVRVRQRYGVVSCCFRARENTRQFAPHVSPCSLLLGSGLLGDQRTARDSNRLVGSIDDGYLKWLVTTGWECIQ